MYTKNSEMCEQLSANTFWARHLVCPRERPWIVGLRVAYFETLLIQEYKKRKYSEMRKHVESIHGSSYVRCRFYTQVKNVKGRLSGQARGSDAETRTRAKPLTDKI